jgi:hypothetical protein
MYETYKVIDEIRMHVVDSVVHNCCCYILPRHSLKKDMPHRRQCKCRHLNKLTCKGTLRHVFTRGYRLEIANLLRTFSHVGIFNPALGPVAPLPFSLVQLSPSRSGQGGRRLDGWPTTAACLVGQKESDSAGSHCLGLLYY